MSAKHAAVVLHDNVQAERNCQQLVEVEISHLSNVLLPNAIICDNFLGGLR